MTHLDKVGKIIDLIYKKTSQRELQWTLYEGDFLATMIASRMVMLSRVDDNYGETVYNLRFYNEDGKVVEQYDDKDLIEISPSVGFDDYYKLFTDLYQQATSIAKGIDLHLDAILSALSDGKERERI